MRNLREAICQKHPDLWKNKNWLLHHDNAPAHTSLLVRDFLAKNNTLMMPQPQYFPDLAPCDFFLFPKLKRPMKGRRYATLDEIKTASKEELKKIFKKDFLKCFEDWKNRWHKVTQIKTYSWDNAQVVLVGNKCDQEDDRVVSTERGKQLADQLGLLFFETSAKENINVKAVFESLVDIICDKMSESLDADPALANAAKATRLTENPSAHSDSCQC
ncbi:hypothetical protein LAZ67_3004436 [Cordylochernes scorpioides]|uniref:Uncharacterized protein n=1 Tax=Cordylochernes scorpioides TaxID=51811 RepID=A0ABY6K9M9_9ARAC|nr:hypothetical protein LAZ67_3004436 [Cordylochernes scorpioides]